MTLTELPVVSTTARAVPPWRADVIDPTVVRLRGEHDISTVPTLAAELARAIARTDADLTVDLSDVQFMDASTIGVILGARQFLESHLRTLTLRSPAPCAQRIIDICDFDVLGRPDTVGAGLPGPRSPHLPAN